MSVQQQLFSRRLQLCWSLLVKFLAIAMGAIVPLAVVAIVNVVAVANPAGTSQASALDLPSTSGLLSSPDVELMSDRLEVATIALTPASAVAQTNTGNRNDAERDAEPTESKEEQQQPRDPSVYVVVGGEQLFQLQSFATLSAQERVGLVRTRIDNFLQLNEEGRIPFPQVEAAFDDNEQFIIRLFNRNSESPSTVHLVTVTKDDAAAFLDERPEEISTEDVGQVARQWTQLLGPALQAEWDIRRARLQGRQPWSIGLGIAAAIAICAAAAVFMKVSDRGIRQAKIWAIKRFGYSWKLVIDFTVAIGRWLARVLWLVLALHFSLATLPILRLLRQKLYQHLWEVVVTTWSIFDRPLLFNDISILSIAAFVILGSFIFVGARRLSNLLKRRLLARLVEDVGSRESFAIVLKYVLTVIGMLILLPTLGINFSSLAIATGAVGLGIGIGLQNLTNNFISGIVMLFERPVQVGDFVEVDGLLGTIEHISLRATIVRTLDSINVIVPNSRFMESNVVSWTYRDSRCRLHVPVGVAYGSDTEVVKQALLKVAREHPRVLQSPAPQVQFQGFGDSALNFELLIWTFRPAERSPLISDLNFAIDAEFRRQQVEMPFPQRDLNIRASAALERLLSPRPQNGHLASEPKPSPDDRAIRNTDESMLKESDPQDS